MGEEATPAQAATTQQTTPTEPLSLDLLRTVKLSHNQYGIRHGNYQHYRHYCTRKLFRLRRSLKVTNGNKRYAKKEIKSDSVDTERYLLIPLYQAERAWAYAMQLKDEAGPSEVPPRTYFHLVRRFAKAVKWCKELSALAADKIDNKTALEIEAYSCWMEGNLLLEKEQWEPVIELLVKARTIYERMAKLGDPEEQELYKDRVNEIDTSLRYCHFNQNGGTIDDIKTLVDMTHSQQGASYDLLNVKLENVLQETRKKQSSGMEKITWKGRVVAIKSDKIRVTLIAADEIRAQLSNTAMENEEKLKLYTDLFMAYGDTLESIRSEMKQITTKNDKQRSSKAESEEANLVYLLKYISYLKLTKTIERNQILGNQLKENLETVSVAQGRKTKPDELVRIYDNLNQNYKELEELVDDEDVEDKKSVVAKGLSCRAIRCYYLAHSYVSNYEWGSAMALLERSIAHIGVAKSHHLDCLNFDKSDVAELEALEKKVQGDKCVLRAKAHLDSLNSKDTTLSSGCLADNLDVFTPAFADTQQLANFPPEFQPTACKPILFDLAHMELEFPSLEPEKAKKSFWKFW